MGFIRGNLILKFADPELEGFEIKMRRLPIGDLMAVSKLVDARDELKESIEQLDSLLTMVMANMISWNLEEEDPETYEMIPVKAEKGHSSYWDDEGTYHPSTGLYLLDFSLVLTIVNTWIEQATSLPESLGKASTNGQKIENEDFALMKAVELANQESLPHSLEPKPQLDSANDLDVSQVN